MTRTASPAKAALHVREPAAHFDAAAFTFGNTSRP